MSERLPDDVMLDDFERLLEIGEGDPPADPDQCTANVMSLLEFIDTHGRRLLLLARTCTAALARQTKGPPP